MWIYLLLLIVIFLLLIFSVIYIVKLSHKFLKKYFTNNYIIWILSFVPILLLILGLFIDTVNAIVVDIHLIIFVALTKLIFFIIKKITKKEFFEYFILSFGIIITLLVMIPAYYQAYNVKQTKYVVYTTKDIGTDKFRIVQISDSHIGTTMDGKEFGKYIEDINKLKPDIVVITGDFVDDNTSYEYMVDASSSLGRLKAKYGVYFIYGNHDKGYFNNRGYNDKALKEELNKNNIIVLEDDLIKVTNNIILIGREDKSNIDRANIIDLTKNIDNDKYIITLDHQPNDYDNEMKSGTDLVLSGHTHGGHIFPIGQFGILLGANDKVYGMKKIDNTTFIVNSGISGWAIKFRTGSIAEYTVIDIVKNNN